MAGNKEKIEDLKKELSKTKYNKRTEHHIGLAKAKLAQLIEKENKRSKSGMSNAGYYIRRSGDATVILIGTPSCGKSTLVNELTGIHSEVGSYSFTTLKIIPGTLKYKGAEIVILDVPGIISGAASGKGRGKEVLSAVRSANMCLILLDATRPKDYTIVKKELRLSGVRLNEHLPDVKIKKKAYGGTSISTTLKLTKINHETIKAILAGFKIMNADVLIREDITDDQLIDAIQGNKKYIKAITVINKTDLITDKQKKSLKKMIHPDLMVSAKNKENLETLKQIIFDNLKFIRIYTKEPSKKADLVEPLIMVEGSTIKDVCSKLHKDLVKKFKYARIWGKSAKFDAQKVMLHHIMKDKDIIEIHTI